MQLRFIYTNMPFWRAEVSRIALFIGDLEFEDLRIDREEFLRAKESGKLRIEGADYIVKDGDIFNFRFNV